MPYHNWSNNIGMEWMSFKDLTALTSMDSILSMNNITHKKWISTYVVPKLIKVNQDIRFPDITDPCIKLEKKIRELIVRLDDSETYVYLDSGFKRNLLELRILVSSFANLSTSTDDFLIDGRTSFEEQYSLTWIKDEE